MVLHLVKMAVGIADLEALRAHRRRRRETEGEGPLRLRTRHRPVRAAEIVDGGSLYWVIKGLVRVRQRVLGCEAGVDGEGRACCILLLDHALVETEPLPFRPFQGWRYLTAAAAPPDRVVSEGSDALPPALISELRALGLW